MYNILDGDFLAKSDATQFAQEVFLPISRWNKSVIDDARLRGKRPYVKWI